MTWEVYISLTHCNVRYEYSLYIWLIPICSFFWMATFTVLTALSQSVDFSMSYNSRCSFFVFIFLLSLWINYKAFQSLHLKSGTSQVTPFLRIIIEFLFWQNSDEFDKCKKIIILNQRAYFLILCDVISNLSIGQRHVEPHKPGSNFSSTSPN